MTDPHLQPQGGRPVIHARQQVGTFSTPTLNHDEIWQRVVSGGLDSRAASLSSTFNQHVTGQQDDAEPDRLDPGDAFDLPATSRMIRSALRPGL